MSVVVQHHVPVEGLLSPISVSHSSPSEVQSHVFKGQQPLEIQRLITAAALITTLWATVLLLLYRQGSSS